MQQTEENEKSAVSQIRKVQKSNKTLLDSITALDKLIQEKAKEIPEDTALDETDTMLYSDFTSYKDTEAAVKKANEEAEISVAKGNDAIKQAARDVLIALRADIEARLKVLVSESVGDAMTPETMSRIILEMVKAYSVRNPSGSTAQTGRFAIKRYTSFGFVR